MNDPRWYLDRFVPPAKPKGITGPLSQAWDYLVSHDGVCEVSRFDDDHAPIGPSLRAQLAQHGVLSSTSRKVTIIFFP